MASGLGMIIVMATAATGAGEALAAAGDGGPAWGFGDRPAVSMPVGADDAGSKLPVYADAAAQEAFRLMGLDFYSHHIGYPGHPLPLEEDVEALDAWARKGGYGYILNSEGAFVTEGDPEVYVKPGAFFQPDPALAGKWSRSPHFMGFCYDEASHWVLDGGWPTIYEQRYAPYFHDARGGSLAEAYAANLANVRTLMTRSYAGMAGNARIPYRTPTVSGEYAMPVLQHLFARAGWVQTPKYLKESITPVHAGMVLGACRQYGVRYWTCVDLWGVRGYPTHSPADLASALLFSYWTGADYAYVENLNWEGSLYTESEEGVTLNAYGEAVREFRLDYLPTHPRSIRLEEFAPETVIVRFDDSDWGQVKTGTWITGDLYGAEDLQPDADTRYWIRIWHVLTHGVMKPVAVNYNNLGMGEGYAFWTPANNVAVYDHLAADSALYEGVKLAFLTGKEIASESMATIAARVRDHGMTVVSTRRLAPARLARPDGTPMAVTEDGRGRWIVTDSVDDPTVRELLRPYLGDPGELRYVFGEQEVVFTKPTAADEAIGVRVGRLAR